jgi:hypothetical protein
MNRRAPLSIGMGLIAAGLVALVIGAAIGPVGPGYPAAGNQAGPEWMMRRGPVTGAQPDPSSPGFIPGTAASPRVISIVATPRLRFVPAAFSVKRGETITFVVTTMGPIVHEFMVGPAEFLRPLYLGESIAPYRLLDATLAVIPWDEEHSKLLDRDAARDAAHINLSRWLTTVEEAWAQHGKRKDELLVPRLDFFGQLSAQLPIAPVRVIYGASGTLPAAAILRDPRAIVEHKLYWTAASGDEAPYLLAILKQ